MTKDVFFAIMKSPPNNTPIIGTWRNEYLHAYIDGAGLANEPKALLFQTYSRATGQLTGTTPCPKPTPMR